MTGTQIFFGICFAVVVALAIQSYLYRRKYNVFLKKYGDPEIVEKIMKRLIWEGMSTEQLYDSWGGPVDRAERISRNRAVYTLKYNQTGKNRYGSRVTVENGIVTGWDIK